MSEASTQAEVQYVCIGQRTEILDKGGPKERGGMAAVFCQRWPQRQLPLNRFFICHWMNALSWFVCLFDHFFFCLQLFLFDTNWRYLQSKEAVKGNRPPNGNQLAKIELSLQCTTVGKGTRSFPFWSVYPQKAFMLHPFCLFPAVNNPDVKGH